MNAQKIGKHEATKQTIYLTTAFATYSKPVKYEFEEAKQVKKPLSEVVGNFVDKTLVDFKLVYGYNKFLYEYFLMWATWVKNDMVNEFKSEIIPFVIMWTCACLLLGFMIGSFLDFLNGIILVIFLCAMVKNYLDYQI